MLDLSDKIFSKLGDVLATLVDGFKDLAKKIVNGFSDLISNMKTWFGDLIDSVVNLFTSLGDWFGQLFSNILNLPSLIIEGFKDLLQFLFVPKDGFLDDKISSVKDTLAKKFDVATYEELLKALKGYVSGTLDFGGYINISVWTNHMDTLKNFIRGFFYPLIVIGDIKWIIWLLRGTSPLGDMGDVSSR